MGELIEAAKALSAPATKLIEVVSRGIGRGYDPRYKKRMADATAYEIDTIAGAIRRNGDVPILFDKEGVQLDARSAQDLIERTGMRLFSQEVRKQQNIESIVDKAYEELKNQDTVSNEPVDDDWIVRFFNSVEDVSNEKLQDIWARILAEEIKKPKSFAMRTLEILKNISLEEAQLFENLAFCLLKSQNRIFIPNVLTILKEDDVHFGDIYALSCAGLINLTLIELLLNVSQQKASIHNHKIIGVIEQKESKPDDIIRIGIYCLTESGKDIANVLNVDNDKAKGFAVKFLSYLKKDRSNYSISAYEVIGQSGGYIHHTTQDLLVD